MSEWSVQQAYSFEKYPLPEGTEFWLTQKLNGVRATFLNGMLYARSGRAYMGLDHITDVITKYFGTDYVLDGELTLRPEYVMRDNEAFRTAAGIVNSFDGDKTKILFTVFDAISRKEFLKDAQETTYVVRRRNIDKLANDMLCKMTKIEFEQLPVRFLPVLYHGNDQTVIWKLLDRMVSEDKEGLMLNTDVPYKRTRHKGILKIKQFYTMDLPIIRCEEGSRRLKGTLGALVVDYKGNEVGVGTGFTDAQRKKLWEIKKQLPGTLCEIKYKEISSDKCTGKKSLQFPVFVALRNDKSEISYE